MARKRAVRQKKRPPITCIDFSSMPQGPLLPPTQTVAGHAFKFSAPGPLEVKPNPPSAPNGLRIPGQLTIRISPPCDRVTVLVSNFASDLTMRASYGAGGVVQTITAPGGNTPAFTFDVTGTIELLEFRGGSNEADVKRICCVAP